MPTRPPDEPSTEKLRALLARCLLVYAPAAAPSDRFVRLGEVAFRLVRRAAVHGLECYGLERLEAGGEAAEASEASGSDSEGEDDFQPEVRAREDVVCGYAVLFGGCGREVASFVSGMKRTVVTRGAERPYLFHVFNGPGGRPLPERRVVVSPDWSSLAGFRGRGPMDLYDNVIAACGRRRRFETSRIATHDDLVATLMDAYARYAAKPTS